MSQPKCWVLEIGYETFRLPPGSDYIGIATAMDEATEVQSYYCKDATHMKYNNKGPTGPVVLRLVNTDQVEPPEDRERRSLAESRDRNHEALTQLREERGKVAGLQSQLDETEAVVRELKEKMKAAAKKTARKPRAKSRGKNTKS